MDTVSKEISLRIKCKKGTNIRIKTDLDMSLTDFLAQLEVITEIPSKQLLLLKDYPPKRIQYDSSKGTVRDLGLKHQDTLIIEADNSPGKDKMKTFSTESSPSADSIQETKPLINVGIEEFDVSTTGILLRHVVPADNSCLFSSVRFCIADEERIPDNNYLRQVIADTVRSDPIKFDSALLGQSNADYSKWIRKSETWGGAIEISILAERYGIEIVVVNIQTATLSRFGEDKGYKRRIFLLYDGIHYDPLYLETPDMHRKIFVDSESHIYAMATQLAQEAKASHQFTDLQNFSLKCNICGLYLKGEREAQSHAMSTRHTDFCEVNTS